MRQWTLPGDRAQSHITRMISGDIKLFMPIRASMFEAQISGLKAVSEWRHSHDLGEQRLKFAAVDQKRKNRDSTYTSNCNRRERLVACCRWWMEWRCRGHSDRRATPPPPRCQLLTLWVLVLSGPLNVRQQTLLFKLQRSLRLSESFIRSMVADGPLQCLMFMKSVKPLAHTKKGKQIMLYTIW